MEKENLLTERDLLVLTACTSIMFIKDFEKVGKFIEETLEQSLMTHEFALQQTFDKCREILKDEYIRIIDKMIAQTKETV